MLLNDFEKKKKARTSVIQSKRGEIDNDKMEDHIGRKKSVPINSGIA